MFDPDVIILKHKQTMIKVTSPENLLYTHPLRDTELAKCTTGCLEVHSTNHHLDSL